MNTNSWWAAFSGGLSLAIMLFVVGLQTARADDEAPAWEDLAPEQQELLQSFEDEWESLPAERRQRLHDGARRWSQLTPEQREKSRERFQQWRDLTPNQRQRARRNFERFKDMRPEQREALRLRMHSSSPEQRQQMRRRMQTTDPQRRRQMQQRQRARRLCGSVVCMRRLICCRCSGELLRILSLNASLCSGLISLKRSKFRRARWR